MTHCLRPYTTVPWPNSHRILYGFPPEERAWEATGHHCTGLSRYLTQKAVPDWGTVVLPTLCLRLPGESKTENPDADFQQQSSVFKRCIFSLSALLLCVVFQIFFFGGGVPLIQLEVYVNSYLSKGKQLRGGGRKGDGYYHLIHHQFLLISHKHLCPTSAKEEKCKCPHSEHRDCPIWGACTWQGCRCPFSHLLPGSSNHPTTTPYNQSTSHSHCFVITSHERESSASPVPCPGLSETRSHWEFRPLPWTYGQFPHSEGGRSLRNPTIDLSLGHCPECIWCGLAMTTSNGVQVNGFLQTINHLRKCCPPKFISQ